MSVLIGLFFSIVLEEDPLISSIVALSSILFHVLFRPDWETFGKTVLGILKSIPMVLFKSIPVLFSRYETFELEEVKCRLCEIVSITLVPDTIVVLSDEFHHVHRVVLKWRGS